MPNIKKSAAPPKVTVRSRQSSSEACSMTKKQHTVLDADFARKPSATENGTTRTTRVPNDCPQTNDPDILGVKRQ